MDERGRSAEVAILEEATVVDLARCGAELVDLAQCAGTGSAEAMCGAGLLKTVIDCIKQHADSAFLQGEACRAVCNIAAQSLAAKKDVNAKSGFQLVLQAQKRCEEDPAFWDGRFEMKRLERGMGLMVNYEDQGRWVGGTVIESYKNGTYDIKFRYGI